MSDEIVFAKEPPKREPAGPGWPIMVVDDDLAVHDVTRLALRSFEFEGRSVELLSAFSIEEAKRLLADRPDVAVVLLDVVMETEQAGLDLIRFIRADAGNDAVRIVLRTGQPGRAPESRIVRDYDINDYRDKTDLTAQKLATTLYAALRSYRDIVRLKELSKDLAAAKSDAEAAAAARDAFLRTAAHELHTPLNAIVGYSDLIGREPYGPLGDARYNEYIWDINANGRALLAMVDNILQAAAGSGETMELEEEAFDLAECVDDCLSRLVEGDHVSIHLKTRSGEAFRLFADRLAVQRMALALLTNALKQSAHDGHFEIAARRLGDGQLILSVIDDNPARGEDDDDGASLGIGIARVLIERHGGRLTFERRQNGGLRTNLIFPKERVLEPGERKA